MRSNVPLRTLFFFFTCNLSMPIQVFWLTSGHDEIMSFCCDFVSLSCYVQTVANSYHISLSGCGIKISTFRKTSPHTFENSTEWSSNSLHSEWKDLCGLWKVRTCSTKINTMHHQVKHIVLELFPHTLFPIETFGKGFNHSYCHTS